MTFGTALFGGLSGFGIAMLSNGIRKLPLLRRPWEHAVLVGIMAYGGACYPELEDETLARVNRMRADRKLAPLEKNAWGLDLGPGKAQ